MGYAKPQQTAHGIHMRLRARSFIVSEMVVIDEDAFDRTEPSSVESKDSLSSVLVGEQQRPRHEISRLRWDHTQEEGNIQSLPRSTPISHLDPSKTICFVSIDAGMVGISTCQQLSP